MPEHFLIFEFSSNFKVPPFASDRPRDISTPTGIAFYIACQFGAVANKCILRVYERAYIHKYTYVCTSTYILATCTKFPDTRVTAQHLSIQHTPHARLPTRIPSLVRAHYWLIMYICMYSPEAGVLPIFRSQ